MIRSIIKWSTTVLTFSQVLLYLPLALDIGGQPALLGLSLFFTALFGVNSILHLVTLTLSGSTQNYRSRPTYRILSSILQLLTIPALLLLALNLYDGRAIENDYLASANRYWEMILTFFSPAFMLLEGLSTLLVIQHIALLSSNSISESTPSSTKTSILQDILQLSYLTTAGFTYVVSIYFLYETFQSIHTPLSALLIGIIITSILYATIISFTINQGNVIETSLILSYAVFQINHIAMTAANQMGGNEGVVTFRSFLKMLSLGKNGSPPLPPAVIGLFDKMAQSVSKTFGAAIHFVSAASSALPVTVLVGLFYRLAVLYMASRIIVNMKRGKPTFPHDQKIPRSSSEQELKALSLKEESASALAMTLLIAFSRLILIAVYTNLLLLSSSSSVPLSPQATFSLGGNNEIFWRWINLFLMTALWGVELLVGDRSVGSGEGRWKID